MRRPPSRRRHSRWLVTRARHDQPRRGAHPTERARSARRQSAAAPGACIESEYSYAAVHWRGYRPRACSSGAPLTPAAFQRLGPSRTVAVERRTAGQLRPMRKACFCVLAACAAASVCADDSVATATVSVDFTAPSTPFPHYWSRCFGSGHALLTLREDWRQQVALAHQEIGVENVRFHGILDDDMATSRGPGEFSFVNVDSFGDFMTSHGMHAIIELSFMPGWLARKPNGTQHTTCAYKGITDAPSNFTQWGEVVGGLVSHLVERYGIDEIAQWKFEVWNEPNTNGAINDGSPNNTATCGGFWYYQLYEHAARAIKSVDKRLQVGGPTTCCCAAWITEFKEYCSSREVPIDFISTHAYTGGNENINSVSSVTSVLQQAKAKADPIPLVITEFGSSYIPGTGNFTTGTSHDDYDAASFLVKLFTEAQGIAEVLSYWSISDVFEEAGMPAVNASFNGDFGLVNIFGVPKPGYRVLQLMHEAGTERINSTVRGSGTCAHTVGALALAGNGSGTAFSVLLYSQSARGGAIEDSCSVTLKLRLSSELSSHRSQPQTVECTVRRIDGDHANPRKKWIELGMPQWPSPEQNDQIRVASELVEEPLEMRSAGDVWDVSIALPAQAVAGVTCTVH